MLGDDVEIEVWWQDETRVGQKNKITRAKTRHQTVSTQGPEDDVGLYLHLPEQGQSCRPRHALCQHGGAERSPRRDRLHR